MADVFTNAFPATPVGGGTFPAEDDVIENVLYGPGDTDRTGKWRPADQASVLDTHEYGINTGLQSGTWHAPGDNEVLYPVAFGVNSTDEGRWYPADPTKYQDGETFGLDNAQPGSYDPFVDAVWPNPDHVLTEYNAVPTPDFGPTGTEYSANWQSADTTLYLTGNSFGIAGSSEDGTYTPGGGIDPEYPPEGSVLLGVEYGNKPELGLVGRWEPASIADVRRDTDYGDTSAPITGTCYVPAPEDTRLDVDVDNTVGLCHVPNKASVRLNIETDVSDLGDMVIPGPQDVRLGESYDSPSVPKEGLLDLPTEPDVRLNESYDNGTKTGQLDVATEARLPAKEAVLDTAPEYGPVGAPLTGVYHGPNANEVYDQADFGPNSAISGTVSVPIEGNVLDSAPGYGPDSLMFGTYDVGAGGTMPDPSDVRLGTAVAQTTGLLAVPDPSEVLETIATDDTVGTLDPNVAANLPLTTRVIESESYGKAFELQGNFKYPLEPQVVAPVGYGAGNGLEFTGQYTGGGSGTVPNKEDVRFSVPVGDGEFGVLELPNQPQVLIDVGYGSYGTEFFGTLTDPPGGSSPSLPPVMPSGQLRSPLFIGDSYTGDRAFEWTTDAPTGWDVGTTTATFSGGACGCDDAQWSATGTVALVDGSWVVTVPMTSDETSTIVADEYQWTLKLTSATDEVITVETGEVQWVC